MNHNIVQIKKPFCLLHLLYQKDNTEIYEAFDYETKSKLVIKRILKTESNLPTILKEINLLERSDHPFVTHFFGYFQDDMSIYILMEFCKFGNLFSLIKKHGVVPESQAKIIFVEIISALEHIHDELNIIHGGIDPSNILFDEFYHVRISDFGNSQFERISEINFHNIINIFSSPEIILKEKLTKKSDIWSLGILLYFMTTGFTPFHFNYIEQLQNNGTIKSIYYPQNLSFELKSLLELLLQVDPKKRPNIKEIIYHNWIKDCKLPYFNHIFYTPVTISFPEKIKFSKYITKYLKIELTPLTEFELPSEQIKYKKHSIKDFIQTPIQIKENTNSKNKLIFGNTKKLLLLPIVK